MRSLVAISILLALTASPAVADSLPDETEIVERVVNRIVPAMIRQARRAIAVGPTVGGFGTFAPSPSEGDGGVSVGLQVSLFDASINKDAIRDAIVTRVKAEVRARLGGSLKADLKRRIRERDLSNLHVGALEARAGDVLDEIVDAVVAELAPKPQLMERPRLRFGVEANYLFDSRDWLARVTAAVGISRLSLGPTFSMRFGDDTVARLGAEAAVHVFPTSGPRSPIFDVFLRADFELHERTRNDDQLVGGVRVHFDLI